MGGLINIILNRGGWISVVSCLISSAIVIFITMPIHEYAHGLVAYKLGDPTPKYQGRMSLNPLRHMDYFGALMILLVGFGWARPVEVDARYFRKPKRDMAIVAFAGPFSNIIIAFISSLLGNGTAVLIHYFFNSGYLFYLFQILLYIFYFITVINVSLAVFNLIPIPPLDGSKILAAFLPERIYYKIMRYERFLYMGLIILIFAGSNFSRVLGNTVGYIVKFLYDLTFLPFSFL